MTSPPFGLSERPFSLTSNPDWFYANRIHEEAYATLLDAARGRKGLVALTGEPGTGKTTVLRRVAGELTRTGVLVWCDVAQTFDEMTAALLQAAPGVASAGDRAARLEALGAFLRAQAAAEGTVTVAIDEAHLLGGGVLGELRRLATQGPSPALLLQIVLAGQPDLERILAPPEPGLIAGAGPIRVRLGPLPAKEVGPYILYRLRRAGCQRTDLFPDESIERVAAYAEGIPRLINQICDNALRVAHDAGRSNVSPASVEAAARALELTEPAGGAPALLPTTRATGQPGAARLLAPPRRALRRTAWTALGLLPIGLLALTLAPRLDPPGWLVPRRLLDKDAGSARPASPLPEDTTAPTAPSATPKSRPTAPPADTRVLAPGVSSRATPAERPAALRPGPTEKARSRREAVSPAERSLLRAAEDGDEPEAGRLLAAGVSSDVRDRNGQSSLMLAVVHGHTSLTSAMLNRGADVNAANDAGITPLMMAASNDRAEILRRLLARGAAVDARNRAGWTALMYASWKGHPEAVRILLDRGADPTRTDTRGWTAAQYAAWQASHPTESGPKGRDPAGAVTGAPRTDRPSYAEVLALLQRGRPPGASALGPWPATSER